MEAAVLEQTDRKSAATAAAVELSRVTMRFTTERGTITALENIDLTVPNGGFLTLLGPSGCGKSTLLRVVSDLIQPTSGSVRILGGDASAARARRDIGFVFQDAALLPWRTALENVALPLEVGGKNTRPSRRTPEELLELVGLSGWEKALPHELSGGMRQRVSIARALVNDPKLLLMDEPFGALDEITRDRHEAAFLGQQVLLLAARPGRVRETVEVPLPSPRHIEQRESVQFIELAAHLRRVLETC
ncbi:MAG: ATP-binding cassette domain-containing protein [Rhizobiales bacterium]|nr:ATP-binding cassette domain-containing protein [Hyphomicrobiales bacterium]